MDVLCACAYVFLRVWVQCQCETMGRERAFSLLCSRYDVLGLAARLRFPFARPVPCSLSITIDADTSPDFVSVFINEMMFYIEVWQPANQR